MFTLFKAKPVVEPEVSQWLIEQYYQLFQAYGHQVFLTQSQLVLPTNEFFPASASSLSEIAQLSFIQVKQHAMLHHWPIDLRLGVGVQPTLPRLEFKHAFYGEKCQVISDYSEKNRIVLSGHEGAFSNPQTAISHLIMQLSQLMLQYSQEQPQQSVELPRIEVLASFLGFGVMLANTTYQFRGGCGSCYKPGANRQHGLSENEMIYALAMFCTLKKIPTAHACRHLKGYLRSVYKQSVKQLRRNSDFATLAKSINTTLP